MPTALRGHVSASMPTQSRGHGTRRERSLTEREDAETVESVFDIGALVPQAAAEAAGRDRAAAGEIGQAVFVEAVDCGKFSERPGAGECREQVGERRPLVRLQAAVD